MTDAPDKRAEGVAKLPDGGSLAYEISGQDAGTPVLLIRPLGGSMALWGSFRAALAQRLCVISFDLRGTGRSSPDPTWVTTRGLAADSRCLLQHLGVPRAHVFGISLGGMTATWLAIRNPEAVAKLCIASAPARGLELTHGGLRRDLALAACFARRNAEVEALLVRRILSRRFREAHPDAVRRIEDLLRDAPSSRAALLKHALAGALHDARRELHDIRAATLVLAGEDDTLLGVDPARDLANAIPRATFDVVPAAGHDLTLEQPAATARRVVDFFLS